MSMWDEPDSTAVPKAMSKNKRIHGDGTLSPPVDQMKPTIVPVKDVPRKESVTKPKEDQLATIIKMQSDLLTHLADQKAILLQTWIAVKSKLRKGVRPEQDALIEMMESLLL